MITSFINGAVFFAFLLGALFFLRFWKRTRDSLFAFFAVSFALLGIERVVQSFTNIQSEYAPAVYLIRLFAFCLIIVAIVRKNMS